MKKPSQNTKKKAGILPLEIAQALVALELDEADGPVLDFFNFFSSQVPVEAAYFIHVLPKIDFFDEEAMEGRDDHPYKIDRETLQRMKLEIREHLSKESHVFTECDIKEGNPLEEILVDSEDIGADLVVIGQTSDTEAHGVLAKNLVRKVKGNALIVPDKAKTSIKKILIPIDFSANSIRALQTAIALNKRLKEPAELICLNVYEMPNLSVYKIGKTREQLKDMLEEDRKKAFTAFLHTYGSEMQDKIQTVLVERDLPGISRYILDFADDNAVDFIIMGAKGHSKVDLLLMGSVTEKLMTLNNRIPSLVIK